MTKISKKQIVEEFIENVANCLNEDDYMFWISSRRKAEEAEYEIRKAKTLKQLLKIIRKYKIKRSILTAAREEMESWGPSDEKSRKSAGIIW